jgi:Type IV secretion system pilin
MDLLNTIKVFAADTCSNSFFGFPTWYKYLTDSCNPQLNGLNDIWLIVLALIEILLRVAVIGAIIYILVGSFKYITSRGNPEKTSGAKKTIVDALVGLVIAVTATAVVSFIAGRFQAS